MRIWSLGATGARLKRRTSRTGAEILPQEPEEPQEPHEAPASEAPEAPEAPEAFEEDWEPPEPQEPPGGQEPHVPESGPCSSGSAVAKATGSKTTRLGRHSRLETPAGHTPRVVPPPRQLERMRKELRSLQPSEVSMVMFGSCVFRAVRLEGGL